MGIFDAGVEIQPPRLLLRLAGARGGLPALEREVVPSGCAFRLFPLRAGQGLLRGGGGQGHVHHVRPARAGVDQRAALGLGPRHLPAHGAQAHELRAQGVGERQRAGLHLFYLLQREPQRAQALDLHQRVQVVLRVVAVAVGGARGAQQPLGLVKAYPGARQAAALLHLLDVHVTASTPIVSYKPPLLSSPYAPNGGSPAVSAAHFSRAHFESAAIVPHARLWYPDCGVMTCA